MEKAETVNELITQLLREMQAKKQEIIDDLIKSCQKSSIECQLNFQDKTRMFKEIFESFLKYPIGRNFEKITVDETAQRIHTLSDGVLYLNISESKDLCLSRKKIDDALVTPETINMTYLNAEKEICTLEKINFEIEDVFQRMVSVCDTENNLFQADHKLIEEENGTLVRFMNEMRIEKIRLEKSLITDKKQEVEEASEMNTLLKLEAQIKKLCERIHLKSAM